MRDIMVISGDLDGAQLRRKQNKAKYFIRCNSKGDHEDIQEAVIGTSQGQYFSIHSEDWERIFGSN